MSGTVATLTSAGAGSAFAVISDDIDLARIAAERQRLRDTYLAESDRRTASSARGLGNGNRLAFFDFPGLDLGPYQEVLGGLHHIAISVEPEQWERLRKKLDEAGVHYLLESKVSIYFMDPDGARLELLADPLGEMYGMTGI